MGIGNTSRIRPNSDHHPDDGPECEEDIDCCEIIVLETELEWREREIEYKIEDEGHHDYCRNDTCSSEVKYANETYSNNDVEH